MEHDSLLATIKSEASLTWTIPDGWEFVDRGYEGSKVVTRFRRECADGKIANLVITTEGVC